MLDSVAGLLAHSSDTCCLWPSMSQALCWGEGMDRQTALGSVTLTLQRGETNAKYGKANRVRGRQQTLVRGGTPEARAEGVGGGGPRAIGAQRRAGVMRGRPEKGLLCACVLALRHHPNPKALPTKGCPSPATHSVCVFLEAGTGRLPAAGTAASREGRRGGQPGPGEDRAAL